MPFDRRQSRWARFQPQRTPAAAVDTRCVPAVRRVAGIYGLAALLIGCGQRETEPQLSVPSAVNIPCPELVAEGWLNGSPPTTAELKHRLVVIDCWGYWCAPCRATAPELVYLAKRYRKTDVVFLGLTADGREHLTEIKAHLAHLKIPWPSGYGATATLNALGVSSLPARLLVNRQGVVIWRGAAIDELAKAVDAQLDLAPSTASTQDSGD